MSRSTSTYLDTKLLALYCRRASDRGTLCEGSLDSAPEAFALDFVTQSAAVLEGARNEIIVRSSQRKSLSEIAADEDVFIGALF